VTVIQDVSGDVDPNGRFISPITVISADGLASITIPAGTIATPPISEISIAQLSVPPSPPPTGENIISVIYDFGPSGTHFSPPIQIVIPYNPVPGISDSNLVIAYYSVSDQQWITLGGTVDSINHTVTVLVAHFTAFAVLTAKTAPVPVTGPNTKWWIWALLGAGLLAAGLLTGAGLMSRRRKYPAMSTVSTARTAAQEKEAAVPVADHGESLKMPAQYTDVTVKLTRGDFTLTPIAVERLFASSQSSPGEEPRVLRITRLVGTPAQMRMFVDKQGPDDIAVTYNGAKILFLSPEAADMLGGIAIDFKTTGNGGEFALSKKKTA
jgi:Fe-S cluster assembly iron-binding protein IscA